MADFQSLSALSVSFQKIWYSMLTDAQATYRILLCHLHEQTTNMPFSQTKDCASCGHFLPALALEPPVECPTAFLDPEGLP